MVASLPRRNLCGTVTKLTLGEIWELVRCVPESIFKEEFHKFKRIVENVPIKMLGRISVFNETKGEVMVTNERIGKSSTKVEKGGLYKGKERGYVRS